MHPMNTRARIGITCPIFHPTLLLTHAEPKTTKQALAAMQSEYDAVLKNNTWICHSSLQQGPHWMEMGISYQRKS